MLAVNFKPIISLLACEAWSGAVVAAVAAGLLAAFDVDV